MYETTGLGETINDRENVGIAFGFGKVSDKVFGNVRPGFFEERVVVVANLQASV